MKRFQLALGILYCLWVLPLDAQVGCPGCAVNVPAGLPEDTVYLPPLPDGVQYQPYSQEISFRLPKTTTPVSVLDTTTPPGLPISRFEILGIDNLPAGLYWEPNQTVFETSQGTDGCVRFCGTPLEQDTFILNVRLKATVFILEQEASFPMRLYIGPQVSATDGFSMTNVAGCGETEVSFTNNYPSNGQPGFSYTWDFGDGTSFAGENPPPHLYDEPGMYVVSYQATIDTIGYILANVTILDADCTDPFNAPDLYFYVKDPDGNVLFNSSPAVNNTPLPYSVPLSLGLGTGNYSVELWDDDSGIKGTDDPCGAVSFNILSNDTLVSGGFRVVLNIIKPVTEVFSTDTVMVYFQPDAPVVNAPQGVSACAGSDSLVLVSSFGAGNHWLLDGELIPGALEFVLRPESSGFYQVMVTTQDGCTAISDSLEVTFFPVPADPVITPEEDLFGCIGTDTVFLNSSYTMGNQWLRNNMAIPGANSPVLQTQVAGFYQVRYTSPQGCVSLSDSVQVIYQPSPALPVFGNNNNFLSLNDTTNLPANYSLQWLFNGVILPGENGFSLCATEDGNYALVLENQDNGCANQYLLAVAIDPNFDCTIGTDDLTEGRLRMYPNPASDWLVIELPEMEESVRLRIYDAGGRMVRDQELGNPGLSYRIDVGGLPVGLYLVEAVGARGRLTGKLGLQ